MISRQATNLMSLDQFAELALVDPFHLAGYCVDDKEAGCNCDRLSFPEYVYQNQYLSRAEVSDAIAKAERMIASELGYWTAPVAYVGESHRYPQNKIGRSHKTNPNMARPSMVTRDGKDYKSITLKWGYIQSMGVYVDTSRGTTTTFKLNTPQTRFTATITFTPASALTGAEEYLVYFDEDDRREGDDLNDWRIRDVDVTIVDNENGTYTATISGGSYLLMKSDHREIRRWKCYEMGTATTVNKLVLYSRVIDETQHGSLQWSQKPCTSGCNDEELKDVCLQRDDEIVFPYVRPKPMAYNQTNSAWESYTITTIPTWVVCNYIAGAPLVNGKVDPKYAMPTFYLAASMLETEAPDCNCAPQVKKRLAQYGDVQKTTIREEDKQTGLAVVTERVLAQKEHLKSSWGANYGAVLAWSMVQSIRENDL